MPSRIGDPELRRAEGHVVIQATQEMLHQAARLTDLAAVIRLGGSSSGRMRRTSTRPSRTTPRPPLREISASSPTSQSHSSPPSDSKVHMDEEKNDAYHVYSRSSLKRRSARSCVKNLDPSAYKELDMLSPQPKRCLKRRSRSADDDPLCSEVDDADELSDSTKKVPGYRCSPHLIPELMEKLSEKQRGWVKNIQWDSFQHMVESRTPKSLTMWLVDRVNTTTGTLDVGGIPVDIREAVVRILKLPCGNLKVPPPLNGRSKAKRPRSETTSLDKKYSVNGRGTSAKAETKHLLSEQEDEEEFCRSFVMLILCIYAAPTTSLNINRNFLPSLLDVSKIRLMDWCGFIAEYLIQGIREFRDSTASNVMVAGCVHILPLMYVDALIRLKALKLPESIELPDGEPRIHFIGTHLVHTVASLDVKCRSKDRVEYGALMNTSERPQILSLPYPAIDAKESVAQKVASFFHEMKYSREQLIEEFVKRVVLSDFSYFQKIQDTLIPTRPSQTMSTHKEQPYKQSSASHPDEEGKNKSGLFSKTITTQSGPTVLPPCPEHCDISVEAELLTHQAEKPAVLVSGASQLESVDHMSPNGAPPGSKPQCCSDMSYLKAGKGVSNLPESDESLHITPLDSSKKVHAEIHNDTPMCPDQHQIGQTIVDTNTSKISLLRTKSTYCIDEVVRIGNLAASEAIMNKEVDANINVSHAPLSMLSEAALMHGSPRFDPSPAIGQRINSELNFMSLASCKHTVDVCSLFVKEPTTSRSHKFLERVDGPAKFDPSPSGQSVPSPFAISKRQVPLAGAFEEALVEEVVSCGQRPLDIPNLNNESPKRNGLCVSSSCNDLQKGQSPASTSSEDDQSSKSLNTESDDKSTSVEYSHDKKEELCSQDDIAGLSSQDFILTPSFTYDSQEVVHIEDDPVNPRPNDIIHIPPLQEELPRGARFKFGGSVPAQTIKMYNKVNKLARGDANTVDTGNCILVLAKDANATYQYHVSNSSAKSSRSHPLKWNINRLRTKIQIKNFHITVGDFVDCLKSKGEVSQTFMGLCSVAIMCDWESNTKIILDQSTIDELLKEGHVCNHEKIAARFRKMRLNEIEQIFMPILTGKHWFLAVVNLLTEIVEFYDSILVVNEGSHPHKYIWENLASNLERAYCLARKKSVHIFFFKPVYPRNAVQENSHDCGFHVIQRMECLKAEDVVGYLKKKTMRPYKRYLCHTLVYHRFNDLNPLRPHLREQIP